MIKERYSLEAALDQARFGTLYRAIDHEQSRYVGLWLLPAEFGRNSVALEAFKRDFARIRLLNHPNIACVYELDHDGDSYFAITEFLDGETLRNVLSHLRPERLDADEADAIVTAIGKALVHAHDRGIVHGDVRVENVLVTMSREFKLLNFTSTSTLRYAPFAARPADDVRDLAALAYELYTGYAPQAKRLVRGKGLPRQRWLAIEAALTRAPRAARSADEFLASAGLGGGDAPPRVERPREPERAAARVAPPRSRWRLGIPALGVAIVVAAFLAAGGMTWMDSAGRGLQLALHDLEARTPAERGAAVAVADAPTPLAAPSVSQQTDPAAPASRDRSADAPRKPEQRVLPVAAVLRDRSAASPPARLNAGNGTDPTVVTVSLSSSALTVRENQPVATIDIVRSGPTDHPVEVIWWTADGTASARDDYAAFGRRLETLAAGQTALTLHIPIGGDTNPEEDEYFYVNLDSKPNGARISGYANAKITIIDDDR